MAGTTFSVGVGFTSKWFAPEKKGTALGIYTFWVFLMQFMPHVVSSTGRGLMFGCMLLGSLMIVAMSSWLNASALAGAAAIQQHLAITVQDYTRDLNTNLVIKLQTSYDTQAADPFTVTPLASGNGAAGNPNMGDVLVQLGQLWHTGASRGGAGPCRRIELGVPHSIGHTAWCRDSPCPIAVGDGCTEATGES